MSAAENPYAQRDGMKRHGGYREYLELMEQRGLAATDLDMLVRRAQLRAAREAERRTEERYERDQARIYDEGYRAGAASRAVVAGLDEVRQALALQHGIDHRFAVEEPARSLLERAVKLMEDAADVPF